MINRAYLAKKMREALEFESQGYYKSAVSIALSALDYLEDFQAIPEALGIAYEFVRITHRCLEASGKSDQADEWERVLAGLRRQAPLPWRFLDHIILEEE